MQSSLRFLALGDSLTAGFYNYGLSYHPYAIELLNLFSSVNMPIIVDQKGIPGECVVPSMINRIENLFRENSPHYDWIIVLGGTNDLAYKQSAENIFNQGLKLIYDMILQRKTLNTKLSVMTIMENGFYTPESIYDKQRQILNDMIRNYVKNYHDQSRICLIDIDKYINYHSIKDIKQRDIIWDDFVHLTPDGYDLMAKIIFQEIFNKINQQ
ncbi:unnamed protein product [Rotaria sp. Silwood2]|nr:unnamed protein product [Rotaria sp. Silwood2]CAF3301954.1 unnamed protein product [Rotaria sp. Silwood2]CAF4131366.1 unnamed protein product [Rotaria sp. Silwood2]CAF4231099.1 unnamed protein product [Rotaria sp. Silwood2]